VGFVSERAKSGHDGSRWSVEERVRPTDEHEKRPAAPDAAIRRGVEDVEAGRVYTLEAVKAELSERCSGRDGGKHR